MRDEMIIIISSFTIEVVIRNFHVDITISR